MEILGMKRFEKKEILALLVWVWFYATILYHFTVSIIDGGIEWTTSYGSIVANFFLVNAIFYLVKTKVNLYFLTLSLFFAVFLAEVDFFQAYFHPTLLWLGLIKTFNPQYGKIIAIFFVLFLMILKYFLTKKHTFYEAFTLLTLGIVIITTFIFHRVTAYGSLPDLESLNKKRLQAYLLSPQKKLQKICKKERLLCILDNGMGKRFKSGEKYLKFFKGEIKFSEGLYYKLGGKMIENTFYRYQLFSEKREAEKNLLLDIHYLRRANEQQQVYFYFLSFCAHFFWMNFYFFLLYAHRKRKILKLT